MIAVLIAPPLCRDAFRSLGASDFMQHMPPTKANRWSIRHFGDGFNPFRTIKQTNGSRRNEALLLEREQLLLRRSGCMGRHRSDGEFRNMRVLRHQPGDPLQPETCPQAINQMRQRRISIRTGKAGLRRIKTFGREGCEPQHIKPETGIARIAERREFIDKQALHAYRITHWRAGAKLDAMHLAISTK